MCTRETEAKKSCPFLKDFLLSGEENFSDSTHSAQSVRFLCSESELQLRREGTAAASTRRAPQSPSDFQQKCPKKRITVFAKNKVHEQRGKELESHGAFWEFGCVAGRVLPHLYNRLEPERSW